MPRTRKSFTRSWESCPFPADSLNAPAKIPRHGRIENEKGRAVVHVFELEPTTG